MELWNSVCKTNPKHTTEITIGKRKFTGIDAYYQIETATKLWGPYGKRWGLQDLSFQYDAYDQLILRS